jgi:hypothetical protein
VRATWVVLVTRSDGGAVGASWWRRARVRRWSPPMSPKPSGAGASCCLNPMQAREK